MIYICNRKSEVESVMYSSPEYMRKIQEYTGDILDERHIAQKKMSEDMLCCESYINKITTFSSIFSFPKFLVFCDLLGISPVEFFHEIDARINRENGSDQLVSDQIFEQFRDLSPDRQRALMHRLTDYLMQNPKKD